MAHLKRQKVPKKWPIARKGTTFVVRPNINLNKGIPLLIILRDMLKICQNRKEVKKALHEKMILINGKDAKDDKNSLLLFDTLSIVPAKKFYRICLSEKGKYILEDIKETEIDSKTTKITNKKILKGKKIQLNFQDGKNYLDNTKCNVGDSVIIDMKKKKVAKVLPLKENAKIIIVEGKHAGKKGHVEKIIENKNLSELNINGEKVNVLIKQIMVVE
jgi:small subunit ribosomal protein S4e